MGILVLLQIYFSSLSVLVVSLSYMAFIMLRYVLSIHFLEIFVIKGVELFHKIFLHLLRWLYLLILQFANVVYWFVNIESWFYHCDKSHLFMVYDLLMYCWNQFDNILLRIFYVFIHQLLTYDFLFCDIFSGFVSKWFWPYRMSSRVFLPQ